MSTAPPTGPLTDPAQVTGLPYRAQAYASNSHDHGLCELPTGMRQPTPSTQWHWSESCREHDGTGFAALIPAHGHNAPDTVRQRTGLPPTLGQGLGLRLVFGRTGHIHDTGPDPGPDPDSDPDPDRNPDSDLLYLTLVLTRCT